jgi:hypothetical protein
MELLRGGALGRRGRHRRRLDDLDAAGTNAVPGSHLLVQLLHGAVEGDVAILLVGVVDAGARVVANPDAEVLDGGGVALENLVDGDDLAVGLLDLAQLAEEVPEAEKEEEGDRISRRRRGL